MVVIAVKQTSNKILKNEKEYGSTDRIIRMIIAVTIAVLFYTGTISGTLGIVFSALAAVFVLTSSVSFCPIYMLFGMSSCAAKKPG